MAKKKTRKTTPKKRTARKSAKPALSPRVLLIAAIVISGLAFSPIPFNDFISLDDDNFILSNPVVQNGNIAKAFSKQLYTPHYKPLVYTSWIIETTIFGNSAFVLHFTNWLLHLINVALVFLCFWRIGKFWKGTKDHALWVGFFGALLFGVHPLHVESVAWAIERKDVMFTCFYLAGLLSYLKFLDARNQRYLLLAGLFYILTLLSKSMGITLIGVVFLMDWASGRRDWKQMLLDKWPFLIGFILALYMYGILYNPRSKPIVGTLGQGAAAAPQTLAEAPGAYQQILIANFRYLFFLMHNYLPTRLALVYPREFLLAAPGGAIHALFVLTAGIFALPVFWKKYRHVLITGLLFFTMAIAPILIEEGPGTNFGSDRYSYVPSLGLMLILVFIVLRSFDKPFTKYLTTGRAVLCAIGLLFAAGAFNQALKWDDSVKLYDQAINNYPENWVALHYRGGTLEDTDPQAALADFTKSLEINPSRQKTFFSRGTLLLKMGRLQEATDDFTRTLELDPKYWKAWVNRGNCLRDLGRNQDAIADYNVVLEQQPRFIKALNNRGVAYLNLGQIQNALADFNRVLQLDPGYTKGLINRAAVYINQSVQQYDNAVADYSRVLELEPDNVQARYFRGYARQKLGQYQPALADVNEAIRLRPNMGMYHYSKAQILRSLGRVPESVTAAQQAQALGYQVSAQYLQQ